MEVPDLLVINSKAANLVYYFKNKPTAVNLCAFISKNIELDHSMCLKGLVKPL
jgi:hypothetical protein